MSAVHEEECTLNHRVSRSVVSPMSSLFRTPVIPRTMSRLPGWQPTLLRKGAISGPTHKGRGACRSGCDYPLHPGPVSTGRNSGALKARIAAKISGESKTRDNTSSTLHRGARCPNCRRLFAAYGNQQFCARSCGAEYRHRKGNRRLDAKAQRVWDQKAGAHQLAQQRANC